MRERARKRERERARDKIEREREKESGLQASKSVFLHEAFPLLYMFFMNCFGIDLEMVLCDLYFKTKSLLFDNFIIAVWYKLYRCDHSILEFESFSSPMNW